MVALPPCGPVGLHRRRAAFGATSELRPDPRDVRPHGYEDALALTVAIFALNAVAFGASALGPMVLRTPDGPRIVERAGRVYVLADLQASVVVLTLLWLTLLQPLSG